MRGVGLDPRHECGWRNAVAGWLRGIFAGVGSKTGTRFWKLARLGGGLGGVSEMVVPGLCTVQLLVSSICLIVPAVALLSPLLFLLWPASFCLSLGISRSKDIIVGETRVIGEASALASSSRLRLVDADDEERELFAGDSLLAVLV